jgi:hypothetical protein
VTAFRQITYGTWHEDAQRIEDDKQSRRGKPRAKAQTGKWRRQIPQWPINREALTRHQANVHYDSRGPIS